MQQLRKELIVISPRKSNYDNLSLESQSHVRFNLKELVDKLATGFDILFFQKDELSSYLIGDSSAQVLYSDIGAKERLIAKNKFKYPSRSLMSKDPKAYSELSDKTTQNIKRETYNQYVYTKMYVLNIVGAKNTNTYSAGESTVSNGRTIIKYNLLDNSIHILYGGMKLTMDEFCSIFCN